MTAWLTGANCDALHTLDLPNKIWTTDAEVNETAEREGRVVITKDADFVDSHLLQQRPSKPLLISTGNIANRSLEKIFVPLVPDIIREFATNSFLELGQSGLSVRG